MLKWMMVGAVALGLIAGSVVNAHHDEPDLKKVAGYRIGPGVPNPNAAMPVANETGGLVRCADGEPLQVTELQAVAAPNVGEVELESSAGGKEVYEVTETAVPRCGPGGSDDPVWIPSSMAELRDAPAKYVRLARR